MLQALRAAIDASEWPRALAEALAMWRETRAPELAELIDELGARLVVVSPPDNWRDRHAWWIEHATRYDPAAVPYLVAHVPMSNQAEVTKAEVLARWGDTNPLIATILEVSPGWFATTYTFGALNTGLAILSVHQIVNYRSSASAWSL